MKLQATKTPLLIAAIATAVTATCFAPAKADPKPYWASADVESAQVFEASFKAKLKKHKFHHGYKFHDVKKKKHVAPKKTFKKKALIKKLF